MRASPKAPSRSRAGGSRTAPPHEIAARGIVLVPERDKVFPNLTVAENLAAPVSRAAPRERRRQEELVYQFFPRLAELRQRIGGLLSGGERQMLAIASALMCRPELLLVDELSLGLAPVVVEDLMARLLADPRASSASPSCWSSRAPPRRWRSPTTAMCMENGRIVLDGDARAARAAISDIQEFYLGQASGERRSYRDRQAISPHPEVVWLSSTSTHLTLRFGGLTVLDGVSLAVERGRAVRADRPEWRRQDQRAQLHQRHLSRRGRDPLPRRATSPAARRTRSRGSASPAPSSTASCSRR